MFIVDIDVFIEEKDTMKKIKIAVLDTGVDLSHPVFKGKEIPQFVYRDKRLVRAVYDPKQGHGTAIAGILVKNTEDCELSSFVLFEDALSIPVKRYIAVLSALLESGEHFDIIHMSLGVRPYSPELEALCTAFRERGSIIVSAFDNAGYVSYPAAFPTVIGVDASPQCQKNNEFIFVSERGIINVQAKGGNQRLAWLNKSYVITQGSSFAAAYLSAFAVNALQQGTVPEEVLLCVKEAALGVLPEKDAAQEVDFHWYSRIKRAAVFPFNKETSSILRFSSALPFEIAGVFDLKRSSNIGRKIHGYTVQNIDACSWDDFDTLILGHTQELEFFSKTQIRQRLIDLCREHKKNMFSFDDELFDETLCAAFAADGLGLYYPAIKPGTMPDTHGKMYLLKTPVLGVFGTSSQQGKFTLQLELRKRFLRDGYAVGQLGTEPESLLFGMDRVYPSGYHGNIPFNPYTCIQYLNYCMADMDRKNYDMLLVGAQSGAIPMNYSRIDNFPLTCIDFLLGVHPDAVILCINPHDKIEDIKRTVSGIEALAKCTVIACSLFPLGYTNEWGVISGAKRLIEPDALGVFKGTVEAALGIPCHVLDEEAGPEALYQAGVAFFSKEHKV
ncbi:MAG: S8 family serine peptidase [Treponema sp.]|nr:S8 family serine peptidase [Treponema sp.]